MQRSYLSLIGGIVMAIAAIALMTVYVRGVLNSSPAPIPMTTAVVAKTELPFGTPLTPDLLQVVAWPRASVPQGAFASTDELFKGTKNPNDRIVIAAMVPGEPVLRSKVSGFGSRPTMSARVPDGMRAVSIHIDDVSGVSGFILPGDHVDVMLTRRINNVLNTDVIFQSITVLGIDQLADQRADKPVVGHTATVEVTPEQAEKLILAQQAGTLSLTLRNQDTLDHVAIANVSEKDLAGPRRERRAEGGPSVRVRYGSGAAVNTTINQ
ncbi:MAG: Flp pilus assembly protein CpaB [Alphaproteobacteria bacterium]|nr:Flp pilus assembly protein CpaB [Alphaproteobacteria bacterium]